MLILFFLVACLAHGAFTVYRVLKERSEVGESDSLIGKVLPHAVFFPARCCGGRRWQSIR